MKLMLQDNGKLWMTLWLIGMVIASVIEKYWMVFTILGVIFIWQYLRQQKADSIYYNGNILTMKNSTPQYVQAICVKNGKITYVGNKKQAFKKRTIYTKLFDLTGDTMMPGFVDPHSHLSLVGLQASAANLLPDPDGKGNNFDELVKITIEWSEKNEKLIKRIKWIVGFGYDDAQLFEKKHPNVKNLDSISTQYPVLFIHQSCHLGVLNSVALKILEFNEKTPNPDGGIIRRFPNTNIPNGVVQQTAFLKGFFQFYQNLTQRDEIILIKKGLKTYAKYGYTTAQDGRASADAIDSYIKAAQKNLLFMDIAVYADYFQANHKLKSNFHKRKYHNHLRIAGVKINLDGSPQGKTAWLSKPYLHPPEDQSADYCGYQSLSDEKSQQIIRDCVAKGWQVNCHCNGDMACQQFIDGIIKTQNKFRKADRRYVMIHAQTVTQTQLDQMKQYGIIPSFFPLHTYYWGEWHVNQTLGVERAKRISPSASALKRNMKFTIHSDAPVTFPNSMRVLWTAVNRITKKNNVLGPDQRIDPYTALLAMTNWAAYQIFEQDQKGSLQVGKLADFVILEQNPLQVDPIRIINIDILRTIKQDKVIFEKADY